MGLISTLNRFFHRTNSNTAATDGRGPKVRHAAQVQSQKAAQSIANQRSQPAPLQSARPIQERTVTVVRPTQLSLNQQEEVKQLWGEISSRLSALTPLTRDPADHETMLNAAKKLPDEMQAQLNGLLSARVNPGTLSPLAEALKRGAATGPGQVTTPNGSNPVPRSSDPFSVLGLTPPDPKDLSDPEIIAAYRKVLLLEPQKWQAQLGDPTFARSMYPILTFLRDGIDGQNLHKDPSKKDIAGRNMAHQFSEEVKARLKADGNDLDLLDLRAVIARSNAARPETVQTGSIDSARFPQSLVQLTAAAPEATAERTSTPNRLSDFGVEIGDMAEPWPTNRS